MPHFDPTANIDTIPEAVPTDLDTVAETGDAWVLVVIDNQLKKLNVANFRPQVETTTNIEDISHAINTANKFTGKLVWNSTTGVLCCADGPLAADTWSEADGTLEHTPA